MEDSKAKDGTKEKDFAEHFMEALFETYRHQYGDDCTFTEVTTGEKPA